MKKYKVLWFVRSNDWNTLTNCGIGNGYVLIGKEHPLFGKSSTATIEVKNKEKFN